MDQRQALCPSKGEGENSTYSLAVGGTVSWTRPLASNLDGYPEIVEVRIRWMNTQYRLLGYRGPGEREFTLLFPALEKGDQFVPLNAPEIATNRMSIVKVDRSRIREHSFG